MAKIHIKTVGNGGNISLQKSDGSQKLSMRDSTMPKYVGARAEVTRTEEGVRIWLKDYLGETEEIVAEAISGITSNADGSLTFILPDGREIVTGSLKGEQGEQGPAGPAGNDGAPGADGTDGYSPTASVTKSDHTATITITDKNGTTTAQISDGEDAENAVTDVQIDGSSIVTDGIAEIDFSLMPEADTSHKGAMSAADKTKLDGIASGAEANVQSDWNQTTSTDDSYIKNKPLVPVYATCTTSSQIAEKVATTASGNFTLTTGAVVYVRFSLNTGPNHATATLQVDNTPAKSIFTTGNLRLSDMFWTAGEVVGFVYDGTNWVAIKGGKATETTYGLVKLSSSTSSSSTILAATPSAVKAAYNLASAAIPSSEKGAASGVCPLDANSKIDASYLPVYNGGVS